MYNDENKKVCEMAAVLKSYPVMKIRIEQLRFELEHPNLIGEDELIRSMSAGHQPSAGETHSGHLSDRTMAIALQYQDVRRKMNSETVSGIVRELRALEAEVQRLELYLSLLSEKLSHVIRLYYFGGKSMEQTASELQVSKRTAVKYRKEALCKLADMYSFIAGVKSKRQENAEE